MSGELSDVLSQSLNGDSERQKTLMNGSKASDGLEQEESKFTQATERANGVENKVPALEQQCAAEQDVMAVDTVETSEDVQVAHLNGIKKVAAAEAGIMEETVVKSVAVVETLVESRLAGSTGSTEKVQVSTLSGRASVKVMNSKKRKAPCGRSTVVFAVVAGVVTVSVASGIVVCRMYPASLAAVSIHFATESAREYLYPISSKIWDVVRLHAANVRTEMSANWLVILQESKLNKAARALQSLVQEDFMRWPKLSGLANVSALSFSVEQVDHVRAQLKPVISIMVDALNRGVEWARSHLKDVELTRLKSSTSDELIEHLQASLLAALAVLVDMAKRVIDWMELRVDEALELIGFESERNRVDLPSEELLESLAANYAAMRKMREALIEQETQALQEVKRSEKRRVAIAEATHSIVTGTRVVVMESIAEAKITAMEYIKQHEKRLSGDFLASIEHELDEYVSITQKLEEEDTPNILAKVVADSQAQVNEALSLKHELALYGMRGYGDSTQGEDNQISFENVALDDVRKANEQIPVMDDSVVDLPTTEPDLRETADSAHEEDQEQAATMELLMDLGEVIAEMGSTLADVTELSISEIPARGQEIKQDASETTYAPIRAKRKEEANQPEEMDALPGTSFGPKIQLVDDLILRRAKQEVTSAHDGERGSSTDDPQLRDPQNLNTSYEDGLAVKTEAMISSDPSIQVAEIVSVFNDVKFEAESVEQAIQSAFESDGSQQLEATNYPSETGIDVIPVSDEVENEIQEAISTVVEATDMAQRLQDEAEEAFAEEEDVPVVGTEAVTSDDPSIQVAEIVSVLNDVTDSVEITIASAFDSDGLQQLEATDHLSETVIGVVPASDEVENEIQEAISTVVEATDMAQRLQDEAEEARVEEELRVIAEEEGITIGQVQDIGDVSFEEPARKSPIIATIQETAITLSPVDDGLKGNESQTSTTVDSSSATIVQAGMVSVAFLMFAGLTAYVFARRHKRGLFVRAPRRPRKWQQFRDAVESEPEEVVLLSDGDSDDEATEDRVVSRKLDLEVVELMSSSDVDGMAEASSGGEDADEEQETSDEEEKAEAVKEEFVQDEEKNGNETESTRSQNSVTDHTQETSNATDHVGTSYSDASPVDASDSDAAYPASDASKSYDMADEPTDIIAQRTRLQLRKLSQE
ncbi:hypothetical protein PHYBOEH_011784 [Phytophthora boehmeriae]|uniref:Transmembrane protein n=1 Tax=Phytophthora boehmeriae TaxID=109152 RepID=A0A8T1X213_9STRA|nr:hypothetical protein PHYBOEH_011784 [Phytophthora boehmeriae]